MRQSRPESIARLLVFNADSSQPGLAQRISRWASSRHSADIWFSPASTSGSTRTTPTTSACWEPLRSPSPSNGTTRRFLDLPAASACRISTDSRRSWSSPAWRRASSTPQIGGAGATPLAPGGVFRIDHDEKFNQTTHLQYQPWKRGPWMGFNWRYDSGLVAGPVPFADNPSGSAGYCSAAV